MNFFIENLKKLLAPKYDSETTRPPTHLKSNDSGFEYVLKWHKRPLVNGESIFGQIVSKNDNTDATAIGCKWRVRLATDSGTYETNLCDDNSEQTAKRNSMKVPVLAEGDLVGVKVINYDSEFGKFTNRFVIVCKLKPEIDPKTSLLKLDA